MGQTIQAACERLGELARQEDITAEVLAVLSASRSHEPQRAARLTDTSRYHARCAEACRVAHTLITAAVAARPADDPA